jgi:hypothetical protein
MSRSSVLIVAAFALVFVGMGTVYIGKSQAQGYCVYHSYGYDPGTWKWCVVRIQDALQRAHNQNRAIASPNGVDGYYGGNTAWSVKTIETNVLLPREYPDGVVSAGGRVWIYLCAVERTGNTYYWFDMGCNYL